MIMKKFEYKLIEIVLEKSSKGLKGLFVSTEEQISPASSEILNELGSQGWEVVSNYVTTIEGWTKTVVYTLKREYE
jgi:hypothetical protein